MRKILFLSLTLILMFSGAVLAETYYVQENTYLYHQPNGESIGILQEGFKIEKIRGYDGNWYKIRVEEDKAYMDLTVLAIIQV